DDASATGLPHLITNVVTTDATVTDVEMLEHIHTSQKRRNLLPDEHIVDAGYTCAELMVSTRRDFISHCWARCASTTPRRLGPGAVATAPRHPSTGTTTA